MRNIENAYTRLTILTELSVLGFGRFIDRSVEWMIKRNPEYLVWMYYNCSRLSFSSPILKKLRILKKYQIDKPGSDKKMFEIVKEKTLKTDPTIRQPVQYANFRRLKKVQSLERIYSRKLFLRSKNQKSKY